MGFKFKMDCFFGEGKEKKIFESLSESNVVFAPPHEIEKQMEMMQFKKEDLQRLHRLKPVIEKYVDELVKGFYDQIMQEPSLREIINTHSHVDKLRKTMRRHILEMFNGRIDEQFVAQRKRIAFIHVRIGLDTKWYMNAFQQLFDGIAQVFNKEIENREELFQAISVLQKMFSLEQQLVLEAYEKETEAIKEKQQKEKEAIQQMMMQTAYELSAIAEQTSSSLQGLLHQFDNISFLTGDGSQAIEKVKELSEYGMVRIDKEKEYAKQMTREIQKLNEGMNQLLNVTADIEKVVETVSSIANQINLLALNATIEAAHAGEYGRGFAVVANEVRKLSDLTKKSTEDISGFVKRIADQIKEVGNSFEEFEKNISENEKITEETRYFFYQIVDAVKVSKEKTDYIFNEIRNSDHILRQIQEATNEIARTAESLSNMGQ
jgi:heam-based aerotactic trancducer